MHLHHDDKIKDVVKNFLCRMEKQLNALKTLYRAELPLEFYGITSGQWSKGSEWTEYVLLCIMEKVNPCILRSSENVLKGQPYIYVQRRSFPFIWYTASSHQASSLCATIHGA